MADNNAYDPNFDFVDKFPKELFDLLRENNEVGVEMRKENIFDDGSAYVIYNVLTSEECDMFAHAGREIGLKPLDRAVANYRINDKAYAEDKDIAQALFERVNPHLLKSWQKGKSVERGVEASDMGDRVWKSYGLNPCFRICRYRPGGFFGAHHDQGYFISPNNRSIQTFMLYLNDNFEGGSTRFFTEDQPHMIKNLYVDFKYEPGSTEFLIKDIRPEAGMAMVFNSQITHDGDRLLSNEKYIVRSEVMYRNI